MDLNRRKKVSEYDPEATPSFWRRDARVDPPDAVAARQAAKQGKEIDLDPASELFFRLRRSAAAASPE
ncbi:MAG: hypothetical protein R2849_20060 [Thermomicrobiales bacterium]